MSAPAALESKVYSVIVNRLLPASQLPDHVRHLGADVPGSSTYPSHPSNLPELILFESRDIIPCWEILSKEWVYFTDYESVDMLSESLLPQAPKFCVRRILYQSSTVVLCSRPVHQRNHITAELELITLTRAYVLSNLVNGGIPTLGSNSLSPHTRRVSLPYSVFLDGFGLYRNAYHSLKGMYVTPAGLDVPSHTQLGNMFVLMIGPFGSSEKGMAEWLAQDSNKVGQGFRLQLDSGEEIIATTFPIMFVGDMPQQNQNSGNKTHNAQFGCRYCFVPDIQRGNLLFDFVASGRYECPVKRLYNGAMSLSSKAARLETLQTYGLTADGAYFAQCYPMLDPQRTNPDDPMHAELRLRKYFAETLVDGMLWLRNELCSLDLYVFIYGPHVTSGKVDTDGTLLKSAKSGRPITLKTVSAANQDLDLELLSAYYKDVLDTALVKNMRYKIHYWGYLSGKTQQRSVYEGYHHFFKLSTPRTFVRLRDDTLLTFYCVHRIMTLTIGTSVSIFLILEALQRDATMEVAAAPYPVYCYGVVAGIRIICCGAKRSVVATVGG
ncbi:hypothetical protein DFP73DRAFT_598623 [Morchella snyderi]|nr:hypothetical protein DFP73DRAFT_598623 [Morchella snyderi]